MMKIFTILILSNVSISVFGQSWCPPGAEWAYQNYGFGGAGSSNLWYAKDTVLNGQACQVIHHRFENLGDERLIICYTFEHNDTVFFSWGEDKFVPWYFFNASVGDTLTIPIGPNEGDCDTILHMLVDSTSTMLIQGETLRYYRAHYIDTNVYPNSIQVLEKFGAINNFFIPVVGCSGLIDFYYFKLGCYEDSSFARYQINSTFACNYKYIGIEEKKRLMPDVNLFPNPANTVLNLQINNLGIASCNFYGPFGNLVLTESVLGDRQQVDISSLSPGLYLLKIQLANGQYAVKRFVKE